MNKLMAVMTAVALSACSSSTTDIAAAIATAQKTAMQLCGFLPYATTIATILGKNVAGLKTAGEIGKAICDQMKSKTEGVAAPKVADVPIEGEFVTPKE